MVAQEISYGSVNGHLIGIAMKEHVRRAIYAIRKQRGGNFETFEKQKPGEKRDIYTTADKEAQKLYLRYLEESFPNYGIIAEEDDFHKPAQRVDGHVFVFAVDGLDGTRAWERRQSHGIASQIALRCNDQIIAACVGDVMTEEMFYFRPESDNVHRIRDYSEGEKLVVDQTKTLAEQYLLMRELPESFDFPLVLGMNSHYWPASIAHPLFKKVTVADGSIGLTFARLWKGEVGGILLEPGSEKPWDIWPCIGISKKMGFEFFNAGREEKKWYRYDPVPANGVRTWKGVRLVIHRSRVEELRAWEMKYPPV